ncbi:hypothetical protein VPNG_02418 [Cytospora leucostoma]|uniref:Uncharacterized protein n=1 Tax=Cytospora leucostoma TaxID=1230097 RepID=A0A423XGI3_9PEZI|nr:hypothetical protein VPNG_02418 [Cytospora leucostoma]
MLTSVGSAIETPIITIIITIIKKNNTIGTTSTNIFTQYFNSVRLIITQILVRMRFAKICTALAAVTGITSAFQVKDTRSEHNDIVDLDDGAHDAIADRSASDRPFSGTAFLRNRAAAAAKTSGKSKTPKCGTTKKRGELGRRANAELYDDEWWVMMGESCPATLVQAGQTISVMDISGCSGLFFFSGGAGSAGKTSAYHITAGEEASEALAAARSAKAAGTTDYYSVYAASASKIADIEKQVKAVLPSIKEHKTATYALDTKNRDERHRMDNKPGSKDVTLSTYSCD